MINYRVERGALEAEVRAVAPSWERRAGKRAASIARAGRYDEKSSIWSEVKQAFMRVQHSKCAFCERKFEDPQYSAIEFDVEHFRPKGDVVCWPDPARHPGLAYDFPTGAAHRGGYYWLAYDLGNYAAACKVCNTILKLNYFPIAGERGAALATPEELVGERPLLCYPIGSMDDDPEDVVTFEATTAIPAHRSGHARRRGLVTIDFFALNRRDQLHRERAQMICFFAPSLRAVSDGRATAADMAVAARVDDARLPHAGCVRAFRRLWGTDRALAERVVTACKAFWASDAGSVPPRI